MEAWCRGNTIKSQKKRFGRTGRSVEMLSGLPRGDFDLMPIHGSHDAADVLSDTMPCWPLLKAGSLICFDDYGWTDPAPEKGPKLAVMRGRCEVVHKDYQVWVRKP